MSVNYKNNNINKHISIPLYVITSEAAMVIN